MPVLANFTYTGIPGVNRLEKNCFFLSKLLLQTHFLEEILMISLNPPIPACHIDRAFTLYGCIFLCLYIQV